MKMLLLKLLIQGYWTALLLLCPLLLNAQISTSETVSPLSDSPRTIDNNTPLITTIPLPIAEMEYSAPVNAGQAIFSLPVTKLTEAGFVQRQLQVNYVLQMAEQVLYLLNYYQGEFAAPAPADSVMAWQTSLLSNDPFIAQIEYVEQAYLSVELRNQTPVVPELQGRVLEYRYQEAGWSPLWSLEELLGILEYGVTEDIAPDSSLPSSVPDDVYEVTISIGPTPLEVFHSMSVITDYCKTPKGYVYPLAGMLPDLQWCPAWHSVVMPSR